MHITNSDLITGLNWRYAVKKFDANKKIPSKDWEALEDALVLTPSSYGIQPWNFVVVNNPEIRQKLLPYSWNQKQVVDASHYVVFAVKPKLTEKDVAEFIDSTAEIRGVARDTLVSYEKMMVSDFINGPRSSWQKEWSARQVYIALGNLMTSAALMGIDTCPMEGLDPAKYDEILGLGQKGLTTLCACAVGYRSSDDKYAQAKKVRFAKNKMISHVD